MKKILTILLLLTASILFGQTPEKNKEITYKSFIETTLKNDTTKLYFKSDTSKVLIVYADKVFGSDDLFLKIGRGVRVLSGYGNITFNGYFVGQPTEKYYLNKVSKLEEIDKNNIYNIQEIKK